MSDNCSMIKMKSLINEAVDNHYELINSPEMIIRVTPATPSLNTTASEQSSEQDPRIMQRVLARWVDKKYYAGRVVDVKDNNKFTIRFDDDHTKTLLNEYIIFGEQNILPLHGQSIYVMLNNEEEYVPAIVTSILEESNRVKYIVQTDGGESGSVMASDIYLTEDQARSIKEIHTSVSKVESNSTPKKMNGQDVSLDNIIHGPRSRRQVTMKAITPKAGSSGLNKHKRTGGRGSKQRKFSESSDRSITEPPSPASYRVAGRLSGRRTSKVTGSLYDNSDPDTVNLLGPIPTSNKIFQKKCFLLTCTEDVSQKLKLARQEACEASGTDSEYSTDAENCTVPFMKERLRHQLEAGGGLGLVTLKKIPQNKYRTCILIAPRPCHTAKYIQCLAANIKAVLHTWVVDCCKSNKLLLEYDLPAGWSIERKCYVRYQIGKERYMRLSSNPSMIFLYYCAAIMTIF
ncbi:TP53-binding protein 1-like [Ctenocephalides felis]|uniref:TP53-binding protein 1-like n=1 Tax=Ctenocephalides felis TaxID=7515 RepID=UPI000E6E44EF|nr:TP53-binding protein 1-like [Ctenocephalides felis]